MSKLQPLIDEIKRWHAAGYSATSVAAALRRNPQTVRNLAQIAGLGPWGKRSLSKRILGDLRAKPDVPPNLEGKYELFTRLWSPFAKVSIPALAQAIGDVSGTRVAEWALVEEKRFKAQMDVNAVAASLWKKQ